MIEINIFMQRHSHVTPDKNRRGEKQLLFVVFQHNADRNVGSLQAF